MRVSPGARRIGAGLALAAIAALSAAGAYYQIFSTFAPYDDEGYLMLSIRHVLDGHRLYDEVQAFAYGPLYYRIGWLIHGPLGVPLTHEAVTSRAPGPAAATEDDLYLDYDGDEAGGPALPGSGPLATGAYSVCVTLWASRSGTRIRPIRTTTRATRTAASRCRSR